MNEALVSQGVNTELIESHKLLVRLNAAKGERILKFDKAVSKNLKFQQSFYIKVAVDSMMIFAEPI